MKNSHRITLFTFVNSTINPIEYPKISTKATRGIYKAIVRDFMSNRHLKNKNIAKIINKTELKNNEIENELNSDIPIKKTINKGKDKPIKK